MMPFATGPELNPSSRMSAPGLTISTRKSGPGGCRAQSRYAERQCSSRRRLSCSFCIWAIDSCSVVILACQCSSRSLSMRSHTTWAHACSCASRSAAVPCHVQAAALQVTGRRGQRSTCPAISPRVIAALQCGHAFGWAAMDCSARRQRIGSSGSATRHCGHLLEFCCPELRCVCRQPAQNRWPLRHWCTCSSGTERQMPQSNGVVSARRAAICG